MHIFTTLGKWMIGLIGVALATLVLVLVAHAQALTIVDWDRNADADQVAFYELYVCSSSKTCSPFAGGARLGSDVPQPAASTAGVVQRVGMPWPANAPLLGRVSAVAVDVMGTKSLESNVVVFRSQPLNAPKGLLVK